jgi:hypothetical protein
MITMIFVSGTVGRKCKDMGKEEVKGKTTKNITSNRII